MNWRLSTPAGGIGRVVIILECSEWDNVSVGKGV